VDDAAPPVAAVIPSDAASEESAVPLQLRNLKAIRGPAPETIRFTHDRDPGFLLPLAAAERAANMNVLLPGELEASGAWESLSLVSVDGSVTTIENPREKFGEARYVFRAANPGMRLVVLENDSEKEKASFGPLQAVHVASTPKARQPTPPAKAFSLVIDGVTIALEPEALVALPTVPLARTGKPAWQLQDWLTKASPACKVASLEVVGAKKTLSVTPSEVASSYMRFNRRGAWKFVLAIEASPETSVREVTRLDVGCASAVAP